MQFESDVHPLLSSVLQKSLQHEANEEDLRYALAVLEKMRSLVVSQA